MMGFNFNDVKEVKPLDELKDSPLGKLLQESAPSFEAMDPDAPIDLDKFETVDLMGISDGGFDELVGRIADSGELSVEKIQNDGNEGVEKGFAIKNKVDGCNRETEVKEDLEKKYPPEDGYTILSEVYLRNSDGSIAKDPETGEARRIDFVVVKDGKVVDSIEVTSQTADKTKQSEKENRIRENGGNYIKDADGNLIQVPDDLQTRIERRD